MKKMFFFPSWNLASVEEKLHALALQDYRLVRVAFSHVFVFQKANAEDVWYIFTYHFLKEYGLCTWRKVFLSERYRGTEIPCVGNTAYSVFRVFAQDEELQTYFDERNRYMRHALRQKMLLSAILLVLLPFAVYGQSVSKTLAAICLAGASISGILLVYCFVGLFKCRKR